MAPREPIPTRPLPCGKDQPSRFIPAASVRPEAWRRAKHARWADGTGLEGRRAPLRFRWRLHRGKHQRKAGWRRVGRPSVRVLQAPVGERIGGQRRGPPRPEAVEGH